MKATVQATKVSEATCYRIKRMAARENSDGLRKLLNPEVNPPGRRSILSVEQQQMIVERLLFAARRGFAGDVMDLKRLMAECAILNGTPYNNGLPSHEAVRAFRSKHRQLSFRSHERKDLAKVKGENYEHVDTFFRILEGVEHDIPGILQNGDRLWNMDETAVDTEYGKNACLL